jgi:prepilin signal peptidase PulO-like enzyme (type II secretory pathway)
MTPVFAIILFVLGVLVGVLVNLLADYLPARRNYNLARHSPFTTVVPARPAFLPANRRVWLWSSLLGALPRVSIFDPPRLVRRVSVEVGLGILYVVLGSLYWGEPFFPFYVFYGAIFALIIVIDVEYRWILLEVVCLGAIGALAEVFFVGRLSLEMSLRGGLLGFGILLALYLAGIGYGAVRRAMTGRAVGRTVLGFGDVLAAAFCGLILGAEAIGPSLLLMMISGGIAAVLLILGRQQQRRRGRRVPRIAAIPYGPYVVLGAALMLYFPSAAIDILRAAMRLVP